jgi:hypothetical protein
LRIRIAGGPYALRMILPSAKRSSIRQTSPGFPVKKVLEGPGVEGPPDAPLGLNDTHQQDAFKVDDYFETFVVYFSPNSSSFQRTLGKLSWNWGGVVVYDARLSTSDRFPHRLTIMYGGTGQRTGISSNQAITYQGTTSGDPSFVMGECPQGPPPIYRHVDDARFFVQQQYWDILQRQPDGAWLIWVSFVTECNFDQTCINNLRIAIARGFFESAEFRSTHPGFDNPGSQQYNEIYVQQLYWTVLDRPPDGNWVGWLNYINQTGNYDGLVGGFINSQEYRDRLNGLPHPQ